VIFALSRVAYAALGVGFDTSGLGYFMQFADPDLLRHDLVRTVVYFHVDPPLMNLVIGLALKAFGSAYGTGLHALFLLGGLVLGFGIHSLLRNLGIGPRTSLFLATLVMLSPATILFENWLYADYLVAVLLVATALFLRRFAATGALIYGISAFSAAGAIVLSRSFFHLVWLLLVLSALLLARVLPWRRVGAAAAIPLLVCVAVYGKNLVLFNNFSAATCTAINLARVTLVQLPDEDRTAMIRQGQLSDLAASNFYALPTVRPDLFAQSPHTGVAVLDQLTKSTGAVNYNSQSYVPICATLQKDAVYVAIHRPDAPARATREAILIFFVPGADYFAGSEPRTNMSTLIRVSDVLASGQLRTVGQPTGTGVDTAPPFYRTSELGRRLLEVGWFVVVAWVLAIVGGIQLLRQASSLGLGRAEKAVVVFALVTVLYTLLVGVVFEAGENNRFQWVADPMVLLLVSGFLIRVRYLREKAHGLWRDRRAA
jgi:hypothetical protein